MASGLGDLRRWFWFVFINGRNDLRGDVRGQIIVKKPIGDVDQSGETGSDVFAVDGRSVSLDMSRVISLLLDHPQRNPYSFGEDVLVRQEFYQFVEAIGAGGTDFTRENVGTNPLCRLSGVHESRFWVIIRVG